METRKKEMNSFKNGTIDTGKYLLGIKNWWINYIHLSTLGDGGFKDLEGGPAFGKFDHHLVGLHETPAQCSENFGLFVFGDGSIYDRTFGKACVEPLRTPDGRWL